MADNKQAVVFLMGPTASGKTEIAAKLHDELEIELVSVDAAQVYRGMDIGTAKPDAGFLARYPHHLIDIRDPGTPYSSAEFCNDASRSIDLIISQKKLPVLTGGAMFYFSAIENGFSALPSTDAMTRMQVRAEIDHQGLESVYDQLARIDPVIARRLAPTDSQRIQRAVEIYRLTGNPPSEIMAQVRSQGLSHPIIKMALFTGDRRGLHKRVEARFETMIERGLVAEVESLLSKLDNPSLLPSMRSVGYRQVVEYLHGDADYIQMIQNGIAATRQLAKRQLTWLRNQSNVVWFNTEQAGMFDSMLTYLKAHPQIMTHSRITDRNFTL